MSSLLQYVLLMYLSLLCSSSAKGFSIHFPFHKHHSKPLPHSDTPIKLPLPIKSTFNLPSSIPNWPHGNGFASGAINLGGLQVAQVTSFIEIWSSQDNQGVSLYEPCAIPDGYFSLGCYAQLPLTNDKPLYGFVLVGKDLTNDPLKGALAKPIDYSLVWTGTGSWGTRRCTATPSTPTKGSSCKGVTPSGSGTTPRSASALDVGASYEVIAADYGGLGVVEPDWLKYMGKWGPKITMILGSRLVTLQNGCLGS